MKKKTVLTAGMVILSFAAIVIFFFLFGNNPPYSYDKNRLLDNKDDYTKIAKTCLEHRALHGKDINGSIPEAGQSHEFTIYCYECKAPLDVDVTAAAKAVRGSFHLAHHTLDGFSVYENFVSFGVVSGSAAFIYSENGQKPTFVNNPDEGGKKPFVEKIVDNWYYACQT